MTMPNFKASGNINKSRFVTISGAKTVAQSIAGDAPIGVSQRGTRDTPLPGASTLAAASGDSLQIYGLGETCQIEASAAIAAGAFLKPDADGKAAAAVATDKYYAQALTPSAAAGELIDIYIVRGVL